MVWIAKLVTNGSIAVCQDKKLFPNLPPRRPFHQKVLANQTIDRWATVVSMEKHLL